MKVHMHKCGCLLVIAMVMNMAPSRAATYTNYVSLAGSDANTGASWEQSYLTLTQAVARAKAAITVEGASRATVLVGAGTFAVGTELILDQPIVIVGQGHEASQTLIRQTANLRVFTVSHADAALEGVVVENGYVASNANGGNIVLSAGTVTNCIVRNNRYHFKTYGGITSSGQQRGGGIYMSGGLVVDSVVSGNGIGHYAWGAYYAVFSHGGGVHLTGGTLRRTIVTNNHVRVDDDDQNRPAHGGGIYVNGTAAVVESCLIADNRCYNSDKGTSAYRGAGIYLKSGTVRNCTVVANRIESLLGTRQGGGIFQEGGTLVNTIVWNNQSETHPDYSGSGQDATYSLAPELTTGTGNQTADPLFFNAVAGNYHLSDSSPAVNAGLNQLDWMTGTMDLAGTPRIQARRVDLGAYEWVAPVGTLFSIR